MAGKSEPRNIYLPAREGHTMVSFPKERERVQPVSLCLYQWVAISLCSLLPFQMSAYSSWGLGKLMHQ